MGHPMETGITCRFIGILTEITVLDSLYNHRMRVLQIDLKAKM